MTTDGRAAEVQLRMAADTVGITRTVGAEAEVVVAVSEVVEEVAVTTTIEAAAGEEEGEEAAAAAAEAVTGITDRSTIWAIVAEEEQVDTDKTTRFRTYNLRTMMVGIREQVQVRVESRLPIILPFCRGAAFRSPTGTGAEMEGRGQGWDCRIIATRTINQRGMLQRYLLYFSIQMARNLVSGTNVQNNGCWDSRPYSSSTAQSSASIEAEPTDSSHLNPSSYIQCTLRPETEVHTRCKCPRFDASHTQVGGKRMLEN